MRQLLGSQGQVCQQGNAKGTNKPEARQRGSRITRQNYYAETTTEFFGLRPEAAQAAPGMHILCRNGRSIMRPEQRK